MKSISASELSKLINSGKHIDLIDVRTQSSFEHCTSRTLGMYHWINWTLVLCGNQEATRANRFMWSVVQVDEVAKPVKSS